MKRTIKRISAILLIFILCMPLTACFSDFKEADIKNLGEYLGRSEKDVLNYLNVSENELEKREYVQSQRDKVLYVVPKKRFKINGVEARITLKFAKDHLFVIYYDFLAPDKKTLDAAFEYAKKSEQAFSAKFVPYRSKHITDKTIADMTRRDYDKSDFENTEWFCSEWIIDDKYNFASDTKVVDWDYITDEEFLKRREEKKLIVEMTLGKTQELTYRKDEYIAFRISLWT